MARVKRLFPWFAGALIGLLCLASVAVSIDVLYTRSFTLSSSLIWASFPCATVKSADGYISGRACVAVYPVQQNGQESYLEGDVTATAVSTDTAVFLHDRITDIKVGVVWSSGQSIVKQSGLEWQGQEPQANWYEGTEGFEEVSNPPGTSPAVGMYLTVTYITCWWCN